MKLRFCLLFIFIFVLGSSAFAMTQEQFMDYVDYAIDNLPTSNNRQRIMFMALKQRGWFENYFFPNYGTYLTQANTIRCYGTSNAFSVDSSSISFGIYFYKAKDSTIFYYNSTDSISFTDLDILYNNYQCYYVNFTILSTGTTNVGSSGYQNPSSIPFSNGFDNDRASVSFVNTLNKQIMNNSSGTSVTTHSYFFKDYSIEEAPAFVFNQNNIPDLVYSQRYKYLGNLLGDYDRSLIWFKMVDQYGHIIATTEDGNIIINSDDEVYCTMRLLYPWQYDLYMGYDDGSFETEIYYYTFSLASGDTGWTGQDTTNNIIENAEDIKEEVISLFLAPADVSGEFKNLMSGDNLANKFGSQELSVPARIKTIDDYIASLAQQTRELLLEDRNYTITFNYCGKAVTLNSNDFIIPDGPIKTFMRTFLVFVVSGLMIKYFVQVIHSVEEADATKIINTTSVNDDSIFL